MNRNEALKQLMLGLIYPAVLGTVLYAVLGGALTPVLACLLGRNSGAAVVPWLKWMLLLTTAAFYCCDYLYIMFTREFRPVFFFFDLFLLAGLCLTFLTIDVSTPTLPYRNGIVVAVCYAVFMALYLIWDVIERFSTDYIAEKQFYKDVIIWESLALGALLAWLGFERLIPNESHRGVALAVVLVVVTSRFGVLAWKKRVFYRADGPTPGTTPDAQPTADAT